MKKEKMKFVSALAIVLACVSCTGQQQPKFAEVAHMLCEGLEGYVHLHNSILSVHQLMKNGDYEGALKVAYTLMASFSEAEDVEGVRELRALIYLLESVVKEIHSELR